MVAWFNTLPNRVCAIDILTTGQTPTDRIITVGLVSVESKYLNQAKFAWRSVHLIFDPQVKSHRQARERHGYDEWTLGQQESFASRADVLYEFISAHDLIVSHDLGFNVRSLNREFTFAGLPLLEKPGYCTLAEYRKIFKTRKSGLGDLCKDIGFEESFGRLDAFQGAWLALQAYFAFHGAESLHPPPLEDERAKIANFRPVPPMPLTRKSPARRR